MFRVRSEWLLNSQLVLSHVCPSIEFRLVPQFLLKNSQSWTTGSRDLRITWQGQCWGYEGSLDEEEVLRGFKRDEFWKIQLKWTGEVVRCGGHHDELRRDGSTWRVHVHPFGNLCVSQIKYSGSLPIYVPYFKGGVGDILLSGTAGIKIQTKGSRSIWGRVNI